MVKFDAFWLTPGAEVTCPVEGNGPVHGPRLSDSQIDNNIATYIQIDNNIATYISTT